MYAGYFYPTQPWPHPGPQLTLPPVFGDPDRQGVCQAEGFALVEQRRFNGSPTQDLTVPLVCPVSGAVLAFWGRLDNRSALLGRLQLPESSTDGELVLAAWRRWGEDLAAQLLGDFSLALYQPQPRRLLLLRDPLGVKPLYYSQQGGQISFATSVASLRAMAHLGLTPDPDWMARYLLHLSMSDRHTGYREVVKLPPGHSLVVEACGQTRLRPYHHWVDDAPLTRRRDPQWVEQYRRVLEEAIRCRMVSDFPLGTENSGGIDSATVTAYLAYFLDQPGDRLHSFGFALCEQEPAYILETSQARQIVHNYLITARSQTNNDLSWLRHSLAVLGYPEEHGNGSGHTPFYQECQRRGIRTLFSGFGGDEVVTNPGHLLRYELYDQGAYRQLWGVMGGGRLRRSLALAKRWVRGMPSPAYRPTFLDAWQERWPHQLLQPQVVERLNLHHEYMETARYDAPYRRINDFIRQGLLTMPYIATRLENCTLMAASYGIDYRWPLWDVRLVQQYLSTPSLEKVGPQGMGRYLHRRAIQGVVPQRVAWKPSKDMGYAALRERRAEGLPRLAQTAKDLEADLHPTLAALVDRPKWRGQIQTVLEGKDLGEGFSFGFRRGVHALQALDTWLKGTP